MAIFRDWLRPPRNLLILFPLVVCLPAATFAVLGWQLLDQARQLATNRQTELLDRDAETSVRILKGELEEVRKRLAEPSWNCDVVDDAVCIVFFPDRIQATPPQPYYPVPRRLNETPAMPFEEADSKQLRDSADSLDLASELENSPDPAIRAGALLRKGRILRRLGQAEDALVAFRELARIDGVSINDEPAELAARKTICGILKERSRNDELHAEATALAESLHSGKWQLDRGMFNHADMQIHEWLGTPREPIDERMADVIAALYEKHVAGQRSTGTKVFDSDDGSTTALWNFGENRDAAFVAGPRYFESHWKANLDQTFPDPARAFVLAGKGPGLPKDAPRVERPASEDGLPWPLVVANIGQPDQQDYIRQSRNLIAILSILVVLIALGSYLIWRAVNRELAVARLQTDFVSAVSHEFRTPLTMLRQFNELLSDEDGPTREKRSRFYQAQARATDRLQRLVESLLDFGRMEAGRKPYRFTSLDAGVLARDIAQEFQRDAAVTDFAVNFTSDSGPHPVSADAEAISRALWNLLDNAAKYRGESHTAEVQVTRSNGTVSIAVRDSGIGIPRSEQATIFQKFVRGAASTSGGIQGTGLGLAMVRHIVQAHGGSVKLISAEGHGSTFTLVLPARE